MDISDRLMVRRTALAGKILAGQMLESSLISNITTAWNVEQGWTLVLGVSVV